MSREYDVFMPQMNSECIRVSASSKAEAFDKARKDWLKGATDLIECMEYGDVEIETVRPEPSRKDVKI